MADDCRRYSAQLRPSLEDRRAERALRFWTAREIIALARETLALLRVAVLLALTVLMAAHYL
jgi:hypothetical protein